ncbi:hypothetical protein ACFVYV_46880 [Streptomyces mirabilis]|uniref:hypothetical protein n=1 Tax=Streptomyces mirabilis TaxID=68239 RepID=UPI0036D99B01
MSLFAIVALSLAGLGVYCAYKNPKLGAAILVGTAILTAFYLVVEKDQTSSPFQAPPPATSSSAPGADPSQGLSPEGSVQPVSPQAGAQLPGG